MRVVLLMVAVFFLQNTYSVERNTLSRSITRQELFNVLDKGTEWVDFPAYSDRGKWESIDPEIRKQIIERGEKSLTFKWDIIKATDYIEFIRSGDRDGMQALGDAREKNLQNLAMAELVEGTGRFTEALANGVWAMCEQSTWVLSAHLNLQKRGAGLPDPDDIVIDLASGRIGATLSWIHYFFASEFDKIHPLIAEKMRKEINNRILMPYYTRTDFSWMAFNRDFVNNWNVWVNFNVLQCILLIETDPQKRTDNIYKAMTSIDKFINYYKDDGGCDEGPSYWSHAGGKFFECLEILSRATSGNVDIYSDELVKNIGRYIYRAYIGDGYFVNFADAAPVGNIYPGLIYRYGKAIHDPVMQDFGAYYFKKDIVPGGTIEAVIRDIFDGPEMALAEKKEPLIKECWLSGTQFCTARDKDGSKSGFYFAAKGGFNDESHNHNDVGTFVLYYNTKPAMIDVGVGTYTRQTFSKERYTIWTMQSGYHNLPVINGIEQKNGRKYAAKQAVFQSNSSTAIFSVDISAAYPEDAAVKYWKRSYQLKRKKSFTITDDYSLSENKGGCSLHFMTACQAELIKPGIIRLFSTDFALEMKYDPKELIADLEPVTIDDPRLQRVWGKELIRIKLDFTGSGLSGKKVIEIKPLP